MPREKWSSRPAFIVAAIGSAIGFGNIWRFPARAYQFGGGAFFIPYLLALIVIGIPLLILEVTIGQYYQTGDAGSFGKINKRFRGVGISSVFSSFVVSTYYCVLLAWVLRMFVYSCQGSEGRWSGVSGTAAFDWFVNVVTGLGSADGLNPTRLVGPNVAALAVVWLSVFLCIAFGVKWTGRIAYFTVGLPVLFLFVLLIRAVTLDGARDGVKAYIGEWDTKVLRDEPAVWSQAVSQVFFSLSITFGVMTAYSSYNERDAPAFSNSIIIAVSNSVYSIIAGFAVFGTVGYIAQQEGKEISELGNLGGPGLVFGTYPFALSTLPGAGHWERLLFVVLFLLGIDSAFSLLEGVITVLHDTALLSKVSRMILVGAVSLAGFLVGLLYCADTGLIFLDTADYYINFMMLLVGFFESFAVGWVYGADSQIKKLGLLPVLAYALATFSSVIVASGLWFGLESGAVWKGFIGLGAVYSMLMFGVFALCYMKKKSSEDDITWKEMLMELFMGNMLKFRKDLVGVVHYIPLLWFFMIRHVVPPLLLILFANLSASKTKEDKSEFGHYEAFPTGYQAFGIAIFSCSCFIIALGLVFPNFYSCFDINTFTEEDEEEEIFGSLNDQVSGEQIQEATGTFPGKDQSVAV